MKKVSTLVLALGLAASLASCSRSNYAFNAATPAYLSSEQVHTSPASVEAETATAIVAAEVAPEVAPVTPAHQAAVALAHAKAVTAPAAVTAPVQPEKSAESVTKKKAKHWYLRTPQEAKAEGKSQLVAVLLSFFLGLLGIHRFYLGYIGIGILELLTGGVFGILALIDFIRILIGDLKPKDGEYAKKL